MPTHRPQTAHSGHVTSTNHTSSIISCLTSMMASSSLVQLPTYSFLAVISWVTHSPRIPVASSSRAGISSTSWQLSAS